MLRFCRNIAAAMRSSIKHTPTFLSNRVSTEFETNSKWKATCVDLCQKYRLFYLKGKQSSC